jgi:glycolate oxidase iron-sulfur subunit
VSSGSHGPKPLVIDGLPVGDARRADAAVQLPGDIYVRATDCVHCGLCLPACPTYTQNKLETDSPRGRIHLMKGLADGRIDPTDAVVGHLDLCLDCRACETACPSGVVYHELLEETRRQLNTRRRRGLVDRLMRVIFFHLFPRPTRLKIALLPARVLQKLRLWRPVTRLIDPLLPTQLRKMRQMLPDDGPLWERTLATFHPARDEPATSDSHNGTRMTVGFFAGCVGSVMFQDVNRKAIDLLTHLGCDVVVPRGQVCCGAIHHHGGDVEHARALAAANLKAFAAGPDGRPVDCVVTAIAGCGAALREYDHLLRDHADHAAATDFTARVRDISELLAMLLAQRGSPPHAVERTVTYNDACHLLHAQGVSDPPRQVLAAIRGLKVATLTESDICCGAAGTYNLSQPAMATDLAERKLRHIQATGATTCVTGNVGCAMQITSEARRLGMELTVLHPVDLLHEAYFGR